MSYSVTSCCANSSRCKTGYVFYVYKNNRIMMM